MAAHINNNQKKIFKKTKKTQFNSDGALLLDVPGKEESGMRSSEPGHHFEF